MLPGRCWFSSGKALGWDFYLAQCDPPEQPGLPHPGPLSLVGSSSPAGQLDWWGDSEDHPETVQQPSFWCTKIIKFLLLHGRGCHPTPAYPSHAQSFLPIPGGKRAGPAGPAEGWAGSPAPGAVRRHLKLSRALSGSRRLLNNEFRLSVLLGCAQAHHTHTHRYKHAGLTTWRGGGWQGCESL